LLTILVRAVQIEQPFRVLPLDAICQVIEGNIVEMEAYWQKGMASQNSLRAVMGLDLNLNSEPSSVSRKSMVEQAISASSSSADLRVSLGG
jgi:hypothetical protein